MKTSHLFFAGAIVLLLAMGIVTSAMPETDYPSLLEQFYSEEFSYEASIPENVSYDINGDGEVDLDDLDELINYLFIDLELTQNIEQRGDFNNDGETTLYELTVLISYLVENGFFDETDAPVVRLLAPSDGKTYKTDDSDRNINFRFEVEDASALNYCQLYIDDELERTLSNVAPNQEYEIRVELDRGSYDWYVLCEDVYGNVGESEVRDFRIKKDSSDDDDRRRGFIYLGQPADDEPVIDFTLPEEEPIITLGEGETQGASPFIYLALILVSVLIVIILISLIFILVQRN